MPRNIVIASTAIATSVAEAFFDSGGRNAGTPFETASTPVIAVQPFANAVSSRKVVSGCVPACDGSGSASGTSAPLKYRYAPARISTKMLTMKKYVGTAKMRPDSRMPRRLPTVSSARKIRHSSTRYVSSHGTAEVIASTPAEMLTDTVSV